MTPPHSLFSFFCSHFETDCFFCFPLLQWDILCDEAKKYVPLTKTIFYAGKLFGAYFFGWVSDRYGRRMTLLITMLVQFLASFIESFSVNFVMYVVLRVPLGICSGGKLDVEISLFLFGDLLIQHALQIECVRSCDQKPYLHNEIKGGICLKIEFNLQKNISTLQDGRRFFVYSSRMAAVTSCEHTLLVASNQFKQTSLLVGWVVHILVSKDGGREKHENVVLLNEAMKVELPP